MGLSDRSETLVSPQPKGIIDPNTGRPVGENDAFFGDINAELSDKGFLVTSSEALITWARTGSLMWMTFGLACCAVEMMHISMPRYDAERFGIRSGISISIPVGFKDRMVFTLASGRPSTELGRDIDPVTAAVSVAFVHSRLGDATGDASLASGIRLSPREAECLRWFAEGMSMPDIALTLGIAYRSVRSYLDEATQKLGASNTRQAASTAIRLRLI